MLGTTHYNHALVILTLDAVTHSLAPCSYRIPNSIYTREEVHSKIVALWDKEWDACGDLVEHVISALAESSIICQEEAVHV